MAINAEGTVIAILPPTASTVARVSHFVSPAYFNATEAVVLSGGTATGTLSLIDATDAEGANSAVLFTAVYGGTNHAVRVTLSPVGFLDASRAYFAIQLQAGIPLTAAIIQGFGGRTLSADIASDVGVEVGGDIAISPPTLMISLST